ncbi:MAG: GWxTD domain-containing protein [Melioribacteraceae bacterium]
MKKFAFTFYSIFFLSTFITAQNKTELNFEFDYARFNYDSSSVYLEFYYELNSTDMQVTPTEKGGVIEAVVHLELKNIATNEYAINKDWKIQTIVDTNKKESEGINDVMGFVVPEGKYSLLLTIHDVKNPNLKRTIAENVVIHPIKKDKFSISDIELARHIKKDDADPKSLFYKNSLEIIPNPTMVYSHLSPVMFFYMELYNLKLPDEKTNFSFIKTLYNSSGTSLYKSTKTIKQQKEAVVEYGVINLSKYPTDSYYFEVSLVDPITKQAFVSTKRFYLYNPNVVDSSKTAYLNTGVINSEFGLYNLDECNKNFSEAKYLATQKEIDQYKKLDSLNAKREFLYNFWKIRDDNPATPQNEFKEEYEKRVTFANKNFTRMNKEGYLTDRGRVVLLYGEPDQRDYYPSESNLKPYEVWFYNQIEGGVSFYFGDVTGFGNYELLHSTKRDELHDENWMRRISTQ